MKGDFFTFFTAAVVITFFVCWAPFHAQRLVYVYDKTGSFNSINDWLYPLAGVFYYFSTTVNPILYNLISVKYRTVFKETLCCSTSSSAITRDDCSSVKETYGYNSRSSQIVRVRSLCEHNRNFE